jgi:hypothetical protein
LFGTARAKSGSSEKMSSQVKVVGVVVIAQDWFDMPVSADPV